MTLQGTLQGNAKGSLPIDALIDHLNFLSSETVNINVPGCITSGVIVEKWQFDGEFFHIRFSGQANELLQAADGPHREFVTCLFNEIV